MAPDLRHAAQPPLAAVLAIACVLAGPVRAQSAAPVDVAALRARSLAASCAQCHGTDGRAPPGATIPGLAGMPEATFLQRMRAYRSAPPEDASKALMRRMAAGYSDAQLRSLAAWFAAVAP